VGAEEGVLKATRGSTELATAKQPILDAARLLRVEGLVHSVELGGEEVYDEVRQSLADVGVYGDAETESIFRHELNVWLQMLRKMRSGESCDDTFPHVLGGNGNLGEVASKVVDKGEDGLMMTKGWVAASGKREDCSVTG